MKKKVKYTGELQELVALGMGLINGADVTLGKGDKESAKNTILKAAETFEKAMLLSGGKDALISGYYAYSMFQQLYLYGLGDYKHVAKLCEDAILLNRTFAPSHMYLGLCRISHGDVPNAIKHLNEAFRLDRTVEIREIATAHLEDIGKRAFQKGNQLTEQCMDDEALATKRFAISAMGLAYGFMSSMNERAPLRAQLTADYAREIGDIKTAKHYEKLAKTE